jgi:uncharacterized protein YciI
MKHFLIEITYTAGPERIAEIRGEHRAYVQTGYDRGLLLYSGPQVPPLGGIVLGRAKSLEEIQTFFDGDPYHIKGVATHRFVEFNPVLNQSFMEPWIKP